MFVMNLQSAKYLFQQFKRGFHNIALKFNNLKKFQYMLYNKSSLGRLSNSILSKFKINIQNCGIKVNIL